MAYLALGGWHGAYLTERPVVYAGRPETDGFDIGGLGRGEALSVETDGPRARPLDRFPNWTLRLASRERDHSRRSRRQHQDGRLRGLSDNLGYVLAYLRVPSTLSVEGMAAFERKRQRRRRQRLMFAAHRPSRSPQASVSDLPALSRIAVGVTVACLDSF